MSRILRAWYVFLGLGLLTLVFAAFVGRVPLEISALVALPQEAPYRVGVNLRRVVVDLLDRRDLVREAGRLSLEVADLEQRIRELELETERLRTLLQVQRTQSPGVVMTAPVVGGDTSPGFARLVLGRGRRSGVVEDMPVTVPEGLVGVVIDVTSVRAVVRLITDPQSRIGVTVRGRGGQGIAVGEVGARLRVIRFNPREPVRTGDLVETSSIGGLFPQGILLGVVEEVLPSNPNELHSSFLVRPAVDMASLLEVALLAPF